jgi:hypothetical protein
MHFEVDEVRPRSHPSIEKRAVAALHDLITPLEVWGYPAVDVTEAFGSETAASAETLVYRSRPISVVLDNHVEHAPSLVNNLGSG